MKKLFAKPRRKHFYIKIVLCFFCAVGVNGQETIDKIVATISDGVRTELITSSDLLWQIALMPNMPLNQPSSEDLNRVLQTIIRQRLIALEAKRLPSENPTKAEADNEIKRILALFASADEFRKRLNIVGFESIQDENFQRMIRERVSIEKYVDFRFRSFVVITPEDEKRYYRNVFKPEFRKRSPNISPPSFVQMKQRINEILTEQRVESDLENFLDIARSRAEINILNKV